MVPRWRGLGRGIRAAPQHAVRRGARGHALPVERVALGGPETLGLAGRQVKVRPVAEAGTPHGENTSGPFFPSPRTF